MQGIVHPKRIAVKIITAIMLCCLLLSGCAQNYVITLNSGRHITAATKPKLVHGNYIFKDVSGEDSYVPSGRVSRIEPASEAKKDVPQFKATPMK